MKRGIVNRGKKRNFDAIFFSNLELFLSLCFSKVYESTTHRPFSSPAIMSSLFNLSDYMPTLVGCSPATNVSTTCCNISSTCTNTTTQGKCTTGGCATGFTAHTVTGTNKTVCLSKRGKRIVIERKMLNIFSSIRFFDYFFIPPIISGSKCTLVSNTDCSKCIQCSSGYAVALDGSCQLVPTVNVTSPLFTSTNYCNGTVYKIPTDLNGGWLGEIEREKKIIAGVED